MDFVWNPFFSFALFGSVLVWLATKHSTIINLFGGTQQPETTIEAKHVPSRTAQGMLPALMAPLLSRFSKSKPTGKRPDFQDDDVIPRFKLYGNTHKTKDLGIEVVWTAEPANIRAILLDQQTSFDVGKYRRNAFWPLLKGGLFINDGAHWKRSRSLLTPNFKGSKIRNISKLEKYSQQMFAAIEDSGLEGKWSGKVDVMEMFGAYSFDSSVEFFIGDRLNVPKGPGSASELEKGSSTPFKAAKAIDSSMKAGSARYRAECLYWVLEPKNFRKSSKAAFEWVGGFVAERLQLHKDDPSFEPSKYPSVLDALVRETQDPAELTSETITLLSGALETTTSLMSWVFVLLARHPEKYALLRTEVLTAFGEEGRGEMITTADQVLALPYLGWVMNETQRLYPTVPMTGRRSNEDIYIPKGGGANGEEPLFVRKGQTVVMSMFRLHRRKDIWGEDAEHFVPERWAHVRPSWDFIPFGRGPRQCPGSKCTLVATWTS